MEKEIQPTHQQSIEQAETSHRHLIAEIIGAAADNDLLALRKSILPLHPADIASILAEIPRESVRRIIVLIGEELDSEVYAELDEDTRDFVLEFLPTQAVARTLEDLDSDDAVAFIEELGEDERKEVLSQTSDEVRASIEGAFAFDEETAGRLMQREFVAAPEFWNVGRTIDHMRATGEDLPDLFFEIYVVDPMFRPVGAIAVSKLMRARRDKPLRDLMEALPVTIKPQTDQEDVAFSFRKYHLISAPVVDDAGRLNGMITVDDMVQVVNDESEEDMLALAGVSDATMGDSIWETVASRLPWLMLNLVTALIASFFISKFSLVLEQIIALAVLMPIVASLGGNSGTQALAVAVRAIASRELNNRNSLKMVLHEMATGLFNGAAIACVLGIIAFVWFHEVKIGITIAIAVILNSLMAGLAGILVPLTLRRLGQDPAVSSGVLVTFATDMVGFVAFLGLASLILL